MVTRGRDCSHASSPLIRRRYRHVQLSPLPSLSLSFSPPSLQGYARWFVCKFVTMCRIMLAIMFRRLPLWWRVLFTMFRSEGAINACVCVCNVPFSISPSSEAQLMIPVPANTLPFRFCDGPMICCYIEFRLFSALPHIATLFHIVLPHIITLLHWVALCFLVSFCSYILCCHTLVFCYIEPQLFSLSVCHG